MNVKQKRNKFLFVMLLSVLVLSGCKEKSKEPSNPNSSKEVANQEVTQNTDTTTKSSKSEQESSENGLNETTKTKDEAQEEQKNNQDSSMVMPPETKELPLYTIDEETLEKKATVVMVQKDEELTPSMVVQLVINDIADKSYKINVKSVTEENNCIIVNFGDDTPPVTGVGSTVECTILDSIAQSLIDNFSECSGVIYRVNGEGYSSGHIGLEKDEVYLAK